MTPARTGPDDSRGSALLWALLFVIVTSGMVISHTIFLSANRRDASARYANEALAASFAQSGLTDATGWFRRQEVQPVVSFDPELDPNAEPPVYDTIDPALGLVREFEINGGLWGRYEVRREEARDITPLRGLPHAGSVWEVAARAFVYWRNDPKLPFDQAPNRVISATAMSSEIRGIPFRLPIAAALCIDFPKYLVFGGTTTIEGGDWPGLGHTDTGTGAAAFADVTGTPSATASTTYEASPLAVFGMSLDSFQAYSDIVFESADFLNDVRAVDQVVTSSQPIDSKRAIEMIESVFVVRGDLYLRTGGTLTVDGVLYVDGKLTVDGDFRATGAVIVRQGFVMQAGSTSTIRYDDALVERMSRKLSQYRLPRSLTPTR